MESSIDQLIIKFKNAQSVTECETLFKSICEKLDINLENYYSNKGSEIGGRNRRLYEIIDEKYGGSKLNLLYELLNKRTAHEDFSERNNMKDIKILIIGAGPVGLRLSIDLALLGFKVFVVEKRESFTRNNVLHLWPYTVVDLKNIGARFFFPQFGMGDRNHISTKKLQMILLKCALLVGVEVQFNTLFIQLEEPREMTGWIATFSKENKFFSREDFDVVIGADGRNDSLPGFCNEKIFSYPAGNAIGITANFINYNTREEADIPDIHLGCFYRSEICDVLKRDCIDLNSLIYHKNDTHYFVMSAKKECLLQKGVLKENKGDEDLLSESNINRDKLYSFAIEVATAATGGRLSSLDFAENHHGRPDASIFSFLPLHLAKHASKIVERKSKRLLMALVGDSLTEPFWPEGSGIGRGFLAAYDTAWMIKQFALNREPIEIITEREIYYSLLHQTKSGAKGTLRTEHEKYSLNPKTRYTNQVVQARDAYCFEHLYDTSNQPIYPPNVNNGAAAVMAIEGDDDYIDNFTSIIKSLFTF